MAHRYAFCSAALLLLLAPHLSAQTIGLQEYGAGNLDGYVLFSPVPDTTTYLIDKCGRLVHHWLSTHQPGQAVYLLDDGSLMRTGMVPNPAFMAGGRGGVIEHIAADGTVLWSYTVSSTQQCAHHDIRPLPNGHVLVLAWERHPAAQATAAGRDPALLGLALWSEQLLELAPVGTDQADVVWEWHLWDHLVQDYDAAQGNYGVVADHPERVDLNFANGPQMDWVHANAVDYNADLDQVIISAHNFSEVWVIDHSTTTAEAAAHSGGQRGHGGDLLYRWGNPQAYGRGTADDRILYGQHNAQWIADGLPHAGDLLVFNNGLGRSGTPYSAIDRWTTPVDGNGLYPIADGQPYAPAAPDLEWTAAWPSSFYAQNISGVQQLSNGGLLICDGTAGTFFELDADGNEVWRYISPVDANGPMTQGAAATGNTVFRCTFIPPDHPALAAFPLTPGDPIELQPVASPCLSTGIATAQRAWSLSPVPTDGPVHVRGLAPGSTITVCDGLGRVLRQLNAWTDVMDLDLSALPAGCYTLGVVHAGERAVQRIVVVH